MPTTPAFLPGKFYGQSEPRELEVHRVVKGQTQLSDSSTHINIQGRQCKGINFFLLGLLVNF